MTYKINFLRAATEHEIAHDGDSGPRPETITVDARSKNAARMHGRSFAKERGWRLMDVREVIG